MRTGDRETIRFYSKTCNCLKKWTEAKSYRRRHFELYLSSEIMNTYRNNKRLEDWCRYRLPWHPRAQTWFMCTCVESQNIFISLSARFFFKYSGEDISLNTMNIKSRVLELVDFTWNLFVRSRIVLHGFRVHKSRFKLRFSTKESIQWKFHLIKNSYQRSRWWAVISLCGELHRIKKL